MPPIAPRGGARSNVSRTVSRKYLDVENAHGFKALRAVQSPPLGTSI